MSNYKIRLGEETFIVENSHLKPGTFTLETQLGIPVALIFQDNSKFNHEKEILKGIIKEYLKIRQFDKWISEKSFEKIGSWIVVYGNTADDYHNFTNDQIIEMEKQEAYVQSEWVIDDLKIVETKMGFKVNMYEENSDGIIELRELGDVVVEDNYKMRNQMKYDFYNKVNPIEEKWDNGEGVGLSYQGWSDSPLEYKENTQITLGETEFNIINNTGYGGGYFLKNKFGMSVDVIINLSETSSSIDFNKQLYDHEIQIIIKDELKVDDLSSYLINRDISQTGHWLIVYADNPNIYTMGEIEAMTKKDKAKIDINKNININGGGKIMEFSTEFNKVKNVIDNLAENNYKDLFKALITLETDIENEKLLDEMYDVFMESDRYTQLFFESVDEIKEAAEKRRELETDELVGKRVGDLSSSQIEGLKHMISGYEMTTEAKSETDSYEITIELGNGLFVPGYYINSDNEPYIEFEPDGVIYDPSVIEITDNQEEKLVNVAGNLTKDIEVQKLNIGNELKSVANFTLVVTAIGKEKQYINFSAYGEKADIMKSYKKGDFVKIFGKEKINYVGTKPFKNVTVLKPEMLKKFEKKDKEPISEVKKDVKNHEAQR